MATLDVISLTEAKAALNLTGTTAHDAELPGWITAVSVRLDKLIGPVVRRTVTAEQHDGGDPFILLGLHPNTSITSVTEYYGTEATALAAETNVSKPENAYLTEAYQPDRALFGSIVRRRSLNSDAYFVAGRRNIEVTYVAGRFADTTSVDERAKKAASLTLINSWRSQQDSTGTVGEFDVPQNSFPRVVVPQAARDMYPREIQDMPILIG